MTYEIALAFDAGSGICLWAKNDAARARYGYPIEHRELPLSENTKHHLTHLIAWFDMSLDWASPSDTNKVWTDEERKRFMHAAQEGYRLLCRELPPPQFVFVDETVA